MNIPIQIDTTSIARAKRYRKYKNATQVSPGLRFLVMLSFKKD